MIGTMIAWAALAQAAPAQPPPTPAPRGPIAAEGGTVATVDRPDRLLDGSQRWSVSASSCAGLATAGEVVVCGRPGSAMRLPLPGERGPPDRAMPSNPDLSGTGALAAYPAPCATRLGGCQVGVDIFGAATALVRLVGVAIDRDSCCEQPGDVTNPVKLVADLVRGATKGRRKAPDRTNRVPIKLDDLPPLP